MSTQLEKLKIFKAINNIEILMHLLKTNQSNISKSHECQNKN